MKKTLLMGIALVASTAMMGQVPGVNAATRASESGVYVLDSIKTLNNRDKPSAKIQYTYDAQNRKVSETNISYGSEWAPVPFAVIYGDSIRYEYNDKGLVEKKSTYTNKAGSAGVDYQVKNYTTYEYNGNGQMTKESVWTYNESVEGFIDRDLTEYEYASDGSLISTIKSNRPTGSGEGDTTIYPAEFVSKVVYVDFIGVDMPRKIEHYTYSKGEGEEEGTWTLGYTYTKNIYENGLLMKSEYCSTRTGEEVVSDGHNYTYDTNGNVTIDEVLGTTAGVLVPISRTVYTYDDVTGKVKSAVAERYSGGAWVVDRPSHYYYSLVTSGGVTGIQNADAQEGVQVYYDAAAKEINAQAEGGISSISIYSATGMEVVRTAVSGERYTQSVGNLEKGLYIVTLITDGRVYSKKIYVNE